MNHLINLISPVNQKMHHIVNDACTPCPTNETIRHDFNRIEYDQFDELFLRLIAKNSCTLDQIILMINLGAKLCIAITFL